MTQILGVYVKYRVSGEFRATLVICPLCYFSPKLRTTLSLNKSTAKNFPVT